jgi:hypothetical protein
MVTDSQTFDAAIAAGVQFPIIKNSLTSKGAGFYHSLWKAVGYPIAGSNPGTAAGSIPNRSTAGAIPFSDAGSLQNYLSRVSLTSTIYCSLILADRVWACSTLNGTLTTAQTIGSPALTRYTDGIGLQLFVEWYTATGSTGTTLTVTYTNQAGTTGRTTSVAFPASPVAGQMLFVPLAAGDTGILSVQSAQLTATTGTAGDFGLTLVKPISMVGVSSANLANTLGAYDTGFVKIDNNACLYLYELCSSTITGNVAGDLVLARG